MGNQYSRMPIEWEINENNCWNCTSHHLNANGYPVIRYDNHLMLMSRFIYENCFGDIPEGQVVRHKCDNPACINPEHLELGTQSDNIWDAVKRGRWSINKGNSKITFEQSEEIKKDTRFQKYIAKDYNISQTQVSRIKRSESWKEDNETIHNK